MQRLKVIQWTTGKVGKLALRGILDDPRLDLVGVYAWSDDKAGQDAGTLCGRPECGVKATRDVDALIATGADSVIYTPFMADMDQVVRLLEAGMDVLSTNLFLNYGGVQGEIEERLAAACAKGNSSLYITGVSPGWINAMVTAMTGVCRDVDLVSIREAADCSVYESVETWQAMGMGLPEAGDDVREMARNWLISFSDAVKRMARSLEIELDELEFYVDYAKTSETVDLGWFKMEKGTNGAVRGGWNGKVDGVTRVHMEVLWYLTKQLEGDWTFDDDQHVLEVKGEPSVLIKLRYIPAEHWGNHEWDTMTAMPAVNALFDVKKAPAGIVTLKDVGLTTAPVGLWLKERAKG